MIPMELHLVVFLILFPVIYGNKCVPYNFEEDFDTFDPTLGNTCQVLNNNWILRPYSSVAILPPDPRSETYITSVAPGSCVSSFLFDVENGGIVEVSVYMIFNELLMIYIYNDLDQTISSWTSLSNPINANSWQTVTLTVDTPEPVRGYLSIFATVSVSETILIDAFRYIPPNHDENDSECAIYNDDGPTEGVTDDGPTEALTDDGPTEAVTDDGPTEPITDDPTEAVTDDDPTEAITDDGPTEAVTDDEPTEGVTDDGPTEGVTDDGPTESVTDGPTDAVTDDRTEAVTDDGPTEAVTDGGPTESVTDDGPTEAVTDDSPTEAVTDDTPTEAVTDGSPTEAVTDDSTTEADTSDENATDDSEEVTTDSPEINDKTSFWTPLTISLVATGSFIVLLIIIVISYWCGKRRQKKKVPDMMFLDIDEIPRTIIVPRVKRVYAKSVTSSNPYARNYY